MSVLIIGRGPGSPCTVVYLLHRHAKHKARYKMTREKQFLVVHLLKSFGVEVGLCRSQGRGTLIHDMVLAP